MYNRYPPSFENLAARRDELGLPQVPRVREKRRMLLAPGGSVPDPNGRGPAQNPLGHSTHPSRMNRATRRRLKIR